MSENKVNINTSGGSISVTGGAIGSENTVVTLGNINAAVNQKLSQLPDSEIDKEKDIKQLLQDLQSAVNSTTELTNEDKADLLEQIELLTEAAQSIKESESKGVVRKAKKIFDATLRGLPAGAQIANACGNLLPLIFKLISPSS